MGMRNWNLCGVLVPADCIAEAQEIVATMLGHKQRAFRQLDKKRQDSKLDSNPDFYHTIAYKEEIEENKLQKTTICYYFQQLARKYGLVAAKDSTEYYNHLAIVNALSEFATTHLLGTPLKGQKQPLFALDDSSEKNPIFWLFEKAVTIRKGKPTLERLLKDRQPVSMSFEQDKVEAEKIALSVAAAVDEQDKKHAAEIAELKAQLALLVPKSTQPANGNGTVHATIAPAFPGVTLSK